MVEVPLTFDGKPLMFNGKPLYGDTVGENPCCLGFNEVIPCCVREVRWRPVYKKIEPPTNQINSLDFDAEFTLTKQDLDILASVNVARYTEQSTSGTQVTYDGGWTNFNWGTDIANDMFIENEAIAYPVTANITVKNHGRHTDTPAETKIEITAPAFEVKGSDGEWRDMPFNSFRADVPADWTIAGNVATTRTLSLGEEVSIQARFTNATWRGYYDFGSGCSGFVKFKTATACYKGSGNDPTKDPTIFGTATEISDCEADAVCECGCQEVDQTCLCEDSLVPPTAAAGDQWNTEEHGEHKRRITGPSLTDTSHELVTFDYLPSDLGVSPIFSNSSGVYYWCGYQSLNDADNAVLVVYFNSSNDSINAILSYNRSGGGTAAISASGDRNSYFAASDTHWNRISVDWIVDGANRRLKLTVEPLDGSTGPTSKESTNVTNFSSHRSPDFTLLGGPYGVYSIQDRTQGCFQNYPAAA